MDTPILKILADYFNSQPSLPKEVKEIADDIREMVYPKTPVVEETPKKVAKKVTKKK